LLETGKLEVCDENTILEISTFEAKGQSYEASDGNHDDLMMNLVMFGYFTATNSFADLTDIDIKQMLFEQRRREIEEDIVPFGYIDNGSDFIETLERRPDDKWQIQDYDPDFGGGEVVYDREW
jgi:hypothetical protein